MTLFEKFRTAGIPVIYIVRESCDDCFSYVVVNNVKGTFKVTDFLIKNGHCRVTQHIKALKPCKLIINRYRLSLVSCFIFFRVFFSLLIAGSGKTVILLRFTPKNILRGYYKEADLPQPHWKIFHFD